jgi:hypothetical protein
VVPYLTDAAIFATLGWFVAAHHRDVVLDYGNPVDELAPELRAAAIERAEHVAALGEPFLSAFGTDALHGRLRAIRAIAIDDVDPARTAEMLRRAPRGDDVGGHIVRVRF